MDLDRAQVVHANFAKALSGRGLPSPKSATRPIDAGLDKTAFLDLFNTQLLSRHLDLLARKLKAQDKGFYTIGSCGHEGNAAIAKAFHVDDMAFLHYRSTAFFIQRAKMLGEKEVVFEQILSLMASKEDPISGGRHKVLGSVPLCIPPQTSTIASHLPKALGAAFSLSLAKRFHDHSFTKLPENSVVLCSFGDASCHQSSAQGAFNAARWLVESQIPLPLVWICEDNKFGISVRTPSHWIEKTFKHQSSFQYLSCDGRNLADVYRVAQEAAYLSRKKKQMVFLHVKTVRLLGHAGSDIECHYRTLEDIETDEHDDPLLHSARTLLEEKWLSEPEVVRAYEDAENVVNTAAKRALSTLPLGSASEIMGSIIPPECKKPPIPKITNKQRQEVLGKHAPTQLIKRSMGQCINLALSDLLLQYPSAVVFGEDVGKKGGVYRITADLQERFGIHRVFDTLLDEQTILGTAIGLAHNGFLPVPEIQFLAYTHTGVDQIRGEAATLSFFSNGQYTNPMVVRIPALAYQKGFGGHFHNDNAIAFLREIPGLIIACPSSAKDAVFLLRECFRQAYFNQRVVIFLEPIALYAVKDLYQKGDGLALSDYPDESESVLLGDISIEGNVTSEIAIISYGNGMRLSRQAANICEGKHVKVKLIDLRWLAPLPFEALRTALKGISKVLIVDECRRTGSLSETLVTWMVEQLSPLPVIARLTGEDTFIPLGKAWEHVLPSCDAIVKKVNELMKERG